MTPRLLPVALLLALSGCPPPISTVPDVEAAGPTAADRAVAALSPYAVTHSRPSLKVVYTWTTKDQVEALRNDPVLLSRTESPVFGSSFFDQVVEKRASSGDAVAKLLRSSAFDRSRFAWPAPWATRLGMGGEKYGDEIIRVTLKSDAIVLMLRTSGDWKAFGVDGREIPVNVAIATPAYIGAVYFVHDDAPEGYAKSFAGPEERLAYREVVLCNEAMIASYEIGTDTIAAELAQSADAMDRMADWLHDNPIEEYEYRWNSAVAAGGWDKAPVDPRSAYEAAIAFPNREYLPAEAPLRALAADLRRLPRPKSAFTHVPTVTFPGAVAPAQPIRKVPRRMGTY